MVLRPRGEEEDEKREKDEERLVRSKRRHWELLRLSIEYLKEHEVKWEKRRLKECTRIREEEKKDRLALVKIKKKKYGMNRVSKEENKRLKSRTEERLELSTAKGNLWKHYRENKEMEDDIAKAWEDVRKSVMELEEEGRWKEEEEDLGRITFARKEKGVEGEDQPDQSVQVGGSHGSERQGGQAAVHGGEGHHVQEEDCQHAQGLVPGVQEYNEMGVASKHMAESREWEAAN